MTRGTQARRELNDLLEEAEASHCCLLLQNEALRGVARRYVVQGILISPYPGMFVRRSVWEEMDCAPRERWRLVQNAYKAAHPEHTLCSFSAALEYGLWVPRQELDTIHIAVPTRSHARVSTHAHRHYCAPGDVSSLCGVSITTLEKTVLDCSLEGSFEAGLAIADSAVRYMGLDLHTYRKYVAKHAGGRPGAQRARDVARYADGGADNAGESIVRARIIEAGFMAPTSLQYELLDPIDSGLLRVDLYYRFSDGRELFGEIDGMEKYGEGETVKRALVHERQRESHLTACNVPVMRILFSRINEPGYLEKLLTAYGVPRK